MLKKFIISALISLGAVSAHALPIDYLGATPYGNGCSEGNYQVIWSPDMTTFTILYSGMSVSIPGVAVNEDDRLHCGIQLHLQVAGQVTVDRIDYRGFYNLSAGTWLFLKTQYFFENGVAIMVRNGKPINYFAPWSFAGGILKNFQGPASDDFTWGSTSLGMYTNVSPCGGATDLDILSDIRVDSDGVAAAAQAGLDSGDGVMAVTYKLNVQPGACKFKFKQFPPSPSIVQGLLNNG